MKKEMKQRIAWMLVWALLVLCAVPESGVAQAAESGASEVVEEDKVKLDANNKDSQGILYTLDATTHTAMVGAVLDEVDENTSEYAGANDGNVVLPEIVVKDDVEYTVTSVAYGAFWGNTEIQSVVLSDTITTLGQKSFYGSSVKTLSIGAGLESMDAYALGRMEALECVEVSLENVFYCAESGILYNKAKTELVKYPVAGSDTTSFAIPEGVYAIGDSAFAMSSLSEVTFPETVRIIENEAFFKSQITKVDLNDVLDIGDYAFSECSQLRWARLRDWVVLGEGAFADDTAMKVVYIPKHTRKKDTLTKTAFYGINNLECLVIEEGSYFSQLSGRQNFERCDSLKTAILCDGITHLPSYFLYKSENIEKVYVPSSLSGLEYFIKETGAKLCAYADSPAAKYFTTNYVTYTDISEHTHTLKETVHYEDDEIEIKGQYCEGCGYGTENSFVVKGESAKEEELVTYELDANCKDEQEILYTLNEGTCTAVVGEVEHGNLGSKNNTSGYEGINDGKVIIPDQVKKGDTIYKVIELGYSAFSYSEMLESIYLPGDVDMVKSDQALMYTHLLESITVSEKNPYYKTMDDVMYTRDQLHLCRYPSGKVKKSYSVVEGTIYIDSYAMKNASNLYELTLPDTVRRLGKSSIESTSIKFLDLRHVRVVGETAVCYNTNLINVVLGENVTCYYSAFAKCSNLQAVYIPKNGRITRQVFNDCKRLRVLVMEEGCCLSGEWIFLNSGLSKAILPEDLPEIPTTCFYDNLSLDKIYIPESVTKIASDFMGYSTTTLYGKAGTAAASYENFVDITDHEHDLQDTVLYESDYIRITAKFCEECYYATDCEQVVLSDPEPTPTASPNATPTATTDATEQEEYVYALDDEYRDAQGIYYKTYKSTDTTGMAFVGNGSSPYSCGYEGANDGHVIIPDKVVKDGIEYTVTRLEQMCFSSNEHLVSIRLPKSIEIINNRSLFNCKNLESIEVDEENPNFLSEDGVLFTKDKTTLLTYPAGKTGSYEVPEGVKTIAKEACYGATFESISFPSSVETIEYCAFYGTTIPYLDLRNVETIGQQAFCSVSGLETVILKPGSQIVYGGFWACDDLKCVYIPENVTIGQYAFYNCQSLQSAIIDSGSVLDGKCTFSNCAKLETVILPNGLTTVPDETFAFTTMDEIYLPQTVTEVGHAAILTSTVTYAYPDVDTTYINKFVDVSEHTHELEKKVFCENEYVRIEGDFCSVCGYGENCSQTILLAEGEETPAPTIVPTATPTQTATPEVTQSPTMTPLPTLGVEPTMMPAVTEKPEPTIAPVPFVTPETLPTPTMTSLPVPSVEPTPTVTPIATAVPTMSPSGTVTPTTSPSVTPQASEEPVQTIQPTEIPKVEETYAPTATPEETPISSTAPLPTEVPIVMPEETPSSTMLPAPGTTEGVIDPIVSPIIIERYYEKEYVVGAVGGFKVSTSDNKTIQLSWQSVSGATGYEVYRATKKNGSYKLLKMVGTATRYRDKSVKANKKYYYKIRVSNGIDSEIRSFSVNGMTAPKVVVKKRKAGSSKYLDIRIKKYKGKFAQIQIRKGKGKFKTLKLSYNRIKKYKGRFKLLYLQKNKWLSVRVRTYKKKGKKKIYSKYSKVVKIRV